MPLYERGNVCIHYEEAGSDFPLLVIPGGGLNSTVAAGNCRMGSVRSVGGGRRRRHPSALRCSSGWRHRIF